MGMLSDIFHKIFPSHHPAVQATTQAGTGSAPAAGGSGQQNVSPPPVQGAPQQTPSVQASAATSSASGVTTAATGPAATLNQQVDVEQILTDMQQQSGQQLNWRTSIVDLLKLLNLDSSLQARKELASELHYNGDTNDSASMNIWLHKQVMTKLAQNGGKVPADLQG